MRSLSRTTLLSRTVPVRRESLPQGPLPDLTGIWQGTVDEFSIVINIVENPGPDGSILALTGTGSMRRLGLEQSYGCGVVGIHQAGPTGVWVHLEAPPTTGRTMWFGHIMAQLDSEGVLRGQFYSNGDNAVGPLVTPDFELKPVAFTRAQG
jgi:hypothetical protein